MTKTFWLSFADSSGCLGVSIVEVDDIDAEVMAIELQEKFPQAKPGAHWIAAAIRRTHVLGCNPGGQVIAAEVPSDEAALLPRNRALTADELQLFGIRQDERSQ